MRISIFNLDFIFKGASKALGTIPVGWTIQIMRRHKGGANTILWVNDNPFRAVKIARKQKLEGVTRTLSIPFVSPRIAR